MTEQPEVVAAPEVAAKKTSGRGIAMFAFLTALCALTLTVFLGYRLIYLQPFALQAEATERLVAASERKMLAQLDAGMADSNATISELARSLRQENLEVQKELQQAVAKSLDEAMAAKPTSPREWRLAEAAFLMRFANHWLLLEGDVETALQALQRADQVLVGIQREEAGYEFDLLPVRSQLAKEILSLQQFDAVDLQGIFLQLQALLAALPEVRSSLTLTVPPVQEAAAPVDGWDAVIRELAKFVRITDLSVLNESNDAADPNDRGPAQLLTARRQAIAAIERAQVAALRSQESLYQSNLAQAKQAAQQLGLVTDSQIQNFVARIDALSQQKLLKPLPTISASLQALDSVLDAS